MYNINQKKSSLYLIKSLKILKLYNNNIYGKMKKNLYDTLWVNKSASKDEIKKAYRKQAMKYHPDRNKWDISAETKFKEINEAYWILSDDTKKKNYDMFWSASNSNPFWGAAQSENSYSSQWWASWFGWFEDIFSNFWGASNSRSSAHFDFSDLFWQSEWFGWWKAQQNQEISLDITHTYEVPIFDLILWCKIEVIWEKGKKVKLKIPAYTKSWTKLRVKWLWKQSGGRIWNLIVKVDAKMPKTMSEVDKNLLQKISENISY